MLSGYMGGFECSICGETFGSVEELDEHVKEAHGSQDVENFECSICGERFESASDLAAHMSGAHPGQ